MFLVSHGILFALNLILPTSAVRARLDVFHNGMYFISHEIIGVLK